MGFLNPKTIQICSDNQMLHCSVADASLINQDAYNLQGDPEKYSISCIILEKCCANLTDYQGGQRDVDSK